MLLAGLEPLGPAQLPGETVGVGVRPEKREDALDVYSFSVERLTSSPGRYRVDKRGRSLLGSRAAAVFFRPQS